MQGGRAEIVEVLIGAGANCEMPTSHGHTPLTLAAEVNAVLILQFFLQNQLLAMNLLSYHVFVWCHAERAC